MAWPESVTYLLLVVLGYALTRVVDLAIEWQRKRLRLRAEGTSSPPLSATARQRLMERRAAYARFRKSVNDAVAAAVQVGHGHYGMLYQIRDAYGDVLRHAPVSITQAADSLIRCVTLLVNLGPSDQRYAMFTRALKNFDAECECDQGLKLAPAEPHHREFSVLGGETETSILSSLPCSPTDISAPAEEAPEGTGSGSGSAPAPT